MGLGKRSPPSEDSKVKGREVVWACTAVLRTRWEQCRAWPDGEAGKVNGDSDRKGPYVPPLLWPKGAGFLSWSVAGPHLGCVWGQDGGAPHCPRESEPGGLDPKPFRSWGMSTWASDAQRRRLPRWEGHPTHLRAVNPVFLWEASC